MDAAAGRKVKDIIWNLDEEQSIQGLMEALKAS
jgi:hypothetical protein